MNKEKNPPISIIIPAYNVEDWIDFCLESVVNQSFGAFEVILINDESTDGTDSKCHRWASIDDRIRYYSQPHGGLSEARNYGIEKALGEYLMFIDSDDWVDNTFVEKLYKKALESKADIVECDFWRVNNSTGEKTYRPSYGRMGVDYDCYERLLYGESVVWKSIFKKSVWINNNVRFPNCLGASHVTYVLFNLLGVSFENVKEPLYYYRRMRKGSIIDNNGRGTNEAGRFGTEEIGYLLGELCERNLMQSNVDVIQRAVKYRFSDLLAAQYGRKDYGSYREQREQYYLFVDKEFPTYMNIRYIVFGGYNLNRIMSYIDNIQDPYCRFNFSGIISVVNPTKAIESFKHNNQYRDKMVNKDALSLLWSVIKEIKPQYIFIDLIDDRFAVIKTEDGYITYSDALDEMLKDHIVGIIVSPMTDEYWNLWKQSTSVFFDRIFNEIKQSNVVIVENYLSEKHGNYLQSREYENIDSIKIANKLLKRKYDYIRTKYDELTWVKAYSNDLYYTDDEYEYGAVPEHLNEVVNKNIAKQIEGRIR